MSITYNEDICSEVKIEPKYESLEENDSGNEQQPRKRRMKIDKQWNLEKEYTDMESAKQAITVEDTWSFSFKNTLTDGDINIYYRCNKVKYRGEQCKSGIYLHCPADRGSVVLYRSTLGHNCHEIRSIARPKITDDIKEEIQRLFYSDPRIKPKMILNVLSKKSTTPPKKTLINNYLAVLRRDKVGCSTLSLGELEEFLRNNSNIPNNETDAYVVAYSVQYDNPNYFRFFVTSKALLKLAKNVKHFHADATHKFIWQGFPVLIVGTTDRNQHFHPFGLGVCSNENTADFEFLFQTIKDGVNNIFQDKISPHTLINDGPETIQEGFKKVFGENSTMLMCWTHVKKNVQKKGEQFVTPKQKVTEVLQDLDKLQLSKTEQMFQKASHLFLEKWADQEQFVSYFKTQWLDKNKNWFEGIANLIPSTNNALETFFKIIKSENTLRERLPLSHFMKTILDYVCKWSSQYLTNMKSFKTEPEIPVKLWTAAYQFAQSKKNISSQPHPGGIIYYIIDEVKETDFKTFDEFKDVCFSAWTTILPTDKDNWINGICDCPSFFKQMVCKHIVGLAIQLEYVVPPSEVKNIPIVQTRKRGRPCKTRKALLVQ